MITLRQRKGSILEKVYFLLLISFDIFLASPVRDPTTCGPSICNAMETLDPKFQYKEGSVYTYQYTVNGTTSVLGGPPTQSGLHLAATISLRFLTACDALLFISNVSLLQSHLEDADQDPSFSLPLNRLPVIKALEQHALRFSYADGVIEEICPHFEESSWALNIKRGFLSAFQNTMRRLDLEHNGQEGDVHGSCKVEYRLGTATSSALNIHKTKDLSSCGDKFGILSSVQGTPYNFGTLHQSMPAVESESACQHVVDRNLLSGIHCTESHRLRSLARGAAGAYMNIQQNLELRAVYSPPLLANNATTETGNIGGRFASSFDEDLEEEEEDEDGEEKLPESDTDQQQGNAPWMITREPDEYMTTLLSNIPISISKRESLLFRHDYNLGQSRTDYGTARVALSNFCSSIRKEVGEKAGELFEILIYILRGLSPNDMMSLSKDAAQICQGDREALDDALEVVGTAASLAVLRERILRGDASPERTQSWIQSLSFIPKPDLSLLTEAVSILRARDKYPHILLSFSNLAHSYCQAVGNPTCIQAPPVIILSKLYEKYFEATKCSTKKRKELDQALVYLKGLGNFGMYSNGTIGAVMTCLAKSDKNEVRVAAIEALRRMPCENGAIMIPILKSIYENQIEDSEVRIAAFLAIMRCPSYPTVIWIKKALENEQVNQVGSFVWTYLTNLQETALPSRAELASLLADETFSTKFSSDIRKFSRNFELSTFYEDLNLGVALDGNVVFSQDSYLPRSTSANLTVDLFGESINVLEATLRVESFEHYVESIFLSGPKSSRNNSPTSSRSSSSSSGSSQSGSKRREKRAILSKRRMRNLTADYDSMKRYHGVEPVASMSLRTFGKEIYFGRWVGMGQQMAALSALKPTAWVMGGSGDDEEHTNWQKSRLVLDSSYIIPTGAGFPLNLSAQASAIIRLESQSLIDSSGSASAGSSAGGTFHVKGKFIPSALLAVAGSMTLSASDIHTGLKIRAHLRSSLALQGGLAVDGSRLLDVEFGLPKSKLELLEYKSELMFMKGEVFKGSDTKNEAGPPQRCSGSLLYTGLRLCSSSHFSLVPKGVEVDEEGGDGGMGDSFVPYFPLNGPSHFTLSLDKANPSLLKTRFHYGWNNNQTTTELTLVTSSLLSREGQEDDSTQETKLGLSVTLDKKTPKFDTEILLPYNTRFTATGEVGTDRISGNVDITLTQKQLTMFSTSLSLKGESQNGGKNTLLKPLLVVTRNNQSLVKAEGELNIIASATPSTTKTFQGKGEIMFAGKSVNILLDGSHNGSTLNLNSVVRDARGQIVQFRSTLTRHLSNEGSFGTESDLSLEFSSSPHRNLAASWIYQVGEGYFHLDADFAQGSNYVQREKDSSNTCFRIKLLNSKSHEGSKLTGLLLMIHPLQDLHWSLGGNLQTIGKSINSSINLTYAPGKTVETSIVVKRAPGVLTFLELGWNASLPNREPLQVSLHLEEKAHRVYQAKLWTDWVRDKLVLDVEYSDKSRRTRLDTSFSVGITTKVLDNLKFGFHILSEEKESKLQLSSDYKSEHYALEVGHNQVGRTGKKHKLVVSMSLREAVYVIMGELDLEQGFHALIKTVLGPKFSDIYARISATSQGGGSGMQVLGIEYRWDASQPSPKTFLAQMSVDASRKYVRRLIGILTFPRYQVDTSGELFLDPERKSLKVQGKLSWRMDDEVGHLHLNGRLGPRREKDDETFDASLQLATPFLSLKNVSLHMELDFLEEGAVCQIKFDSSWKDEKERLGGSLLCRLNRIEKEEQGGEGDTIEHHHHDDHNVDEEDELSEADDENEIYRNHHHHNGPNPFKFSCEGNISSTITTLKVVNLKFNYVFLSYFNTKTDLDIQLPNEKEISVSSQWVLPRGWSELLSTRAELHIKTPFVGYQNVDLQGILGRKEDRDVLALIGIYVESFQYAISITGTPRFEQDGALGFDVTTSNPKYDKIFGSLSYVFGDTTRVACQLGWPPQVVVGIEAGWEWVSWGDFQIYHTLNTPWVPVKRVDALLKVDATQSIELKLEANEDSITGKCEWIALSWTNFDIRLDGSSPFEVANKFGFVVKNSWEDEVAYDSQALGWINEQQLGYKLDGGQSEVEEEDGVAIVFNSQLEMDTLNFYPTIRALVTLAQRDSRFNLASSLTLREGPINLDATLDLLDVFRFNENISLTTPYPGLLQLEITLSPAILFQQGLYNLGLHSKWRSYSQWHTGGLWIRLGPQEALSDVLTQEARDTAFLTGTGEDDEEEVVVEQVIVPRSQLLHFYSPLAWARLIKVEYEDNAQKKSSGEGDAGVENKDQEEEPGEEDDVMHFPIRKFEIAYSGEFANISAEINNEARKKRLVGVVDVWLSDECHPSFKVDGLLDLSEAERSVCRLLLGSYSPSTAEYSVSSSWSSDLPHFLQGKIEAKSPHEDWEEQSGSVMYAHNVQETSYSVDMELTSLAFDKLATNIMIGPKTFSMTLNTPIESFSEMELRGDISSKNDGDNNGEVNTLIVAKCGEKEIEMDIDSELSENGWPTKLTGTMSTTFGPEVYRHGAFSGDVVKWEGGLNASGIVQWKNVNDPLRTTLHLLLPDERFQDLKIWMETPFRGKETWELGASRLSLGNQSGLQINLVTPIPQLTTLTGQALLDYDGISLLDLKKLSLKAEAPGGVIGSNSSWSLQSWNGCNFALDTKYFIPILSNYSFPPENGMKLKFRNIIPTMDHFTRVDIRFLAENSIPLLRLGAGISSEYLKGESFLVKATSKYGRTFGNLDLLSNFDSDFEHINVSLSANATGFHSHGNLQMIGRREGSASIGWSNDGRLSSSSFLLQSRFNCSWPSSSAGGAGESEEPAIVHLRLDSVTANNTITPLISMDGSFNRILARHSVQVQLGQMGEKEGNPIRLEMDFMLASLQHFSSAFNFSSNFYLLNDTGMIVYSRNDGSEFNGYLDGHWNEDRAFLKYFWDHERTDEMFKFNISLDTELPLTTESVPKPQSASIKCSYQTQSSTQRTESSFNGVYNGVQLLDSIYSSNITNITGLEKNELFFKLDNHFWPFGLISLNQFEYSPDEEEPTKRLRRVEVYDLHHPHLHKLEGELQIKTNFTGSKMTLTGRHPNRTVELMGDYTLSSQGQLRHTTRLSWGPGNSWMGYELDLFNRTQNRELMREAGLGLRLTYPLRVITLRSGISLQSFSINKWSTELNLNAGQAVSRNLVGVVSWGVLNSSAARNSKIRQLGLELQHPALPKGLRVDGRLETENRWEWIEGKLVLDHTGELKNGVSLEVIARPHQFATFEGGRIVPHWNLSTEANLHHPATGLELKSGLWTLHSLHELSIITLIDFKNCKKSVPEESKIFAFELFKQLRKAHIMIRDPEDYFILKGHVVSGQPQLLQFSGEANISGVNPVPQARFSLDLSKPYFKTHVVHGKEYSNGVYSEGGVIDSRNVRFDVWESVDNLRFSDVSYFLRLNHSRLITSKLKWRPELFSEIQASIHTLHKKLKTFASVKGEQLKSNMEKDVRNAASAWWDDAKGNLEPFWTEFEEQCDFRNDSAALQFFLEEMYTLNEFYVQDVLGYSQLFLEEVYVRISAMWEKLLNYREELASESYQALEAAALYILGSIKEAYHQLVTAWENYTADPWGRLSSVISFAGIKEKLYLLCYYSIGFVVKVGEAVFQSLSTLATTLLGEITKISERYQPQILTHLHQIETFVYDFIVKMTDYLYERKEEVMKSQYYQKLAQLAHDVDDLYRDISKNDAVTNIKKFYGKLKTFLARKLSEMDDLVPPLGRVGEWLVSLWDQVRTWELAQILKTRLNQVMAKISWLMEYTNLDETIQELLVILYTQGSNLFSQTVLQASSRHQTAKTKFIFDADKGVIFLEQKLPMPWAAFNETPDFQRLPEYENIIKWQERLKSAKSSFWTIMHQRWWASVGGPYAWLPPFDGHAMMIFPEYILTFDGLAYNLGVPSDGLCNYVLVADLVDANFTVSLEAQRSPSLNKTLYNIIVSVGHNVIVMDMEQKGLRDPKRGGQLLNLPLQMPNIRGFQENMELVVESPKGITVSCNVLHYICQFHVSGWYSRKVGGLLGTMDEESSTDPTSSSGRKGLPLLDIVNSWQFSDDTTGSPTSCETRPSSVRILGASFPKSVSICQKLYHRPMSSLQPCFATVNTDPFYEMCLIAAENEKDLCTSIAAYLTACKTTGILLKTPSMCVKCEMNGEEMMDRDMKVVISSAPPGSPPFLSTDVVFIVEAKECNRAFRTRRKIDTLSKYIEQQLQENHFKHNRYAAVLFGGDGIFEKPRAVVQGKEVFTQASNIGEYFASLPTGNGSRDIFNGISYTLQHLNFRPGASKTLILFPCSFCQPQDMTTVDYTDLYYAMLEQGATLHIILDEPFTMDNKNMAKKIFGIDSDSIFTKADASLLSSNNTRGGPKSNVNSRRLVKVPRSRLGYCAPLALQTNGSIFTTKKLQTRQGDMVNLFSKVVGDRVAKTATPSACQACYCSSTGVECFDCEYPRYEPRPEEDEDELSERDLIGPGDNVDNVDADSEESGEDDDED